MEFQPGIIGYGHFGAVKGPDNVMSVLKENLEFSHYFKDFIFEKFTERAETRYVVDQFYVKRYG